MVSLSYVFHAMQLFSTVRTTTSCVGTQDSLPAERHSTTAVVLGTVSVDAASAMRAGVATTALPLFAPMHAQMCDSFLSPSTTIASVHRSCRAKPTSPSGLPFMEVPDRCHFLRVKLRSCTSMM